MPALYKISGPDIVHEDFGGDLVVLNLESGQYFGLNPAGAVLWNTIVAGQDLTDCINDKDKATAANAFAKRLMELGLITPYTPDTHAPTATISFEGAPTIEVYDDLSDLIIADPIHDVDAEAGWPHMPDSGSQSG